MITLENVTYTYPRGRQPALRDISLTVPAGQFCAVVGNNSAGKSTLCYALTGFVPHFYKGTLTGRLVVDGRSVADTPLADLASAVGLVFANPFNQITGARFTVREEIAFGLENMGVPRADMLRRTDEMLALTGLADLADRSPYALSGGQQQRLAIASVLVMQPRLLVLDEPTSQLDPVGTQEIFTVIDQLAARGGTTVVLVSHKLEWIGQFAERVVLLADGEIVADGAPRDILSQWETPTRYTQASAQARAAGLTTTTGPLPVTLDEAAAFLGAPAADSAESR